MNFLVGTLYSGEREMAECLRSLSGQVDHAFRQIVVDGYSHRKAHEVLYQAFMEHAGWADRFVKLDADMVLSNKTFFRTLAKFLHHSDNVRDLEIALRDFFTGERVWGLHVYSSEVTWSERDELFVDQRPVSVDEHRYVSGELATMVSHAPNPYPAQALMHGLKRGLKTLELTNPSETGMAYIYRKIMDRFYGREETSTDRKKPADVVDDHWTAQQVIHERFRDRGDVRLGLSTLGFEVGLTGEVDPDTLSYSAPEFQSLVRRFSGMNERELERRIDQFKRRNWGSLPSPLRRKVLRFLYQSGLRGE